jgi:hypothetical protein
MHSTCQISKAIIERGEDIGEVTRWWSPLVILQVPLSDLNSHETNHVHFHMFLLYMYNSICMYIYIAIGNSNNVNPVSERAMSFLVPVTKVVSSWALTSHQLPTGYSSIMTNLPRKLWTQVLRAEHLDRWHGGKPLTQTAIMSDLEKNGAIHQFRSVPFSSWCLSLSSPWENGTQAVLSDETEVFVSAKSKASPAFSTWP